MGIETIIELLTQIHLYYPVGIPQVYRQYPGYKLIEQKLEKKIDELSKDENVDWIKLVSDVNKEFSSYKVHDFGYYQFPNYYMEIELEQLNEKGFEVRRVITVCISLLVNYFTVFMVDFYKFSNFENKNVIGITPSFRIVYNKSTDEKIYIESIEFLITLIEQHFKTHKFLPHSDLLNLKLSGSGAFGDMESYKFGETYSAYRYLFNNDNMENTEILI
jgi:hypothetical protein